MRAQFLMTTGLALLASAFWFGTSRITVKLAAGVRRGLSLKCLLLGHEDWVRRAPGRIYLECFDCGRETPGWTTLHTPPAGSTLTAAGPLGLRSRRVASEAGAIPAMGINRSGRPDQPAGRREELRPAA